MVKLSVCADCVLTELPFEARVSEIADAGFVVDMWRWRDHDIDALADLLASNPSIEIGSMTGYAHGSIVTPDAVDEFMDGIAVGVQQARRLRCRQLAIATGGFGKFVGTGSVVAHAPAANPIVRWTTAYEALSRIAEIAEEHDLYYNLEHLNRQDHPGYPIELVEDALALIDAVGSPRIRLLLDIYHLQVAEGNVCGAIRECAGRIGYVHVADVPGRHEPGTGEINWDRVLDEVMGVGYEGNLGLEAFPTQPGTEILADFRAVFGRATAEAGDPA